MVVVTMQAFKAESKGTSRGVQEAVELRLHRLLQLSQVRGFVVVLVWQWMHLCKAGRTQGRCRSGGCGGGGGGGESTLDSSDLVL